MNASESDRHPVEELAEEFVERYRRGERPAIEEYTSRYPQWADRIQALFPALVVMEKVRPERAELRGAEGDLSAGAVPRERLGDYRILREVGRGGMGKVYEAEQESLGRHVALKVLPLQALLDPRHVQRFKREARAAARLHHTNIVPVHGVGEQDGLHYYVMQFIRGQGLDQVLAELQRLRRARQASPARPTDLARTVPNQLAAEVTAEAVARSLLTGHFVVDVQPGADAACGSSPRPAECEEAPQRQATVGEGVGERSSSSLTSVHLPGQAEGSSLSEAGWPYWHSVARIGLQVADALAYASSQGILHRDIKPSNLLLDTRGTVWVTDFGLAKAETEHDDATSPGEIVGTLRYMAPERFQGKADVRSDLYALGLTLYELLTLRSAFDETDRNQLIAQVMHETPPRPRSLDTTIPRDLETIVLKAIAREPAHRYQTPAELAEDLQRFLDDRPIKARRLSPAQHAWRWCRRNPALAALGGTLALAVVGLAAAAGLLLAANHEANRQRDRANLQRDKSREHFLQARTAVDRFHTQVSQNPELKAHGLEPLRQKLLESAVEYYQQFVEQQDEDPALRAEQGRAYRRLADLAQIMGRTNQAEAAYHQAQAIFRRLAEADPQEWVYQEELALCGWRLGLMYQDAGRYTLAEPPYQEALVRAERLGDAQPGVLAYQQDLGNIQHSLARLYRDTGRYALAEPLYDKALMLRRRLVQEHSGVAVHEDELAWTLFNLANLYSRTGRRKLSETTYLENLDIWQRLADAHPESPDYQDQVGMTLNNLGNLYENTGRPQQAQDTRRRCLAVRLRLAQAHPQVEDYQEALCKIHENVGTGYQLAGQLELAERAYRQALTIRQQLMDRYPDIQDIAVYHAANEYNMGILCRDRGQWQEEVDWYGRAAQRLETILQKEPRYDLALVTLCSVEDRRAVVLSRLGRRSEAEQALKRAAAAGTEQTDRESRLCRALVRAHLGDRASAVAKAAELDREAGLTGFEILDLARIYALCRESTPAVAVLRKARQTGYLQSADSAELLRRDADLMTLSSDPGFREFLAGLDKPTK
jgi:serine/threonine protein kinase